MDKRLEGGRGGEGMSEEGALVEGGKGDVGVEKWDGCFLWRGT